MPPFKNIVSSYVPCSEHYFVAQQPNKKILRASCLYEVIQLSGQSFELAQLTSS